MDERVLPRPADRSGRAAHQNLELLGQAARAREDGAREAVCRIVFRIAYHVAAKRFGFVVEDAEDVAQEIVVRSLEKLSLTTINASWVHTGATFLCIDIVRRRRTASLIAGETRNAHPLPPVTRAELMLMLDHLPPSCRSLLVKHFIEGFTFAELDAMRGDGRRRCEFEAKRCLDCLGRLARRRSPDQ